MAVILEVDPSKRLVSNKYGQSFLYKKSGSEIAFYDAQTGYDKLIDGVEMNRFATYEGMVLHPSERAVFLGQVDNEKRLRIIKRDIETGAEETVIEGVDMSSGYRIEWYHPFDLSVSPEATKLLVHCDDLFVLVDVAEKTHCTRRLRELFPEKFAGISYIGPGLCVDDSGVFYLVDLCQKDKIMRAHMIKFDGPCVHVSVFLDMGSLKYQPQLLGSVSLQRANIGFVRAIQGASGKVELVLNNGYILQFEFSDAPLTVLRESFDIWLYPRPPVSSEKKSTHNKRAKIDLLSKPINAFTDRILLMKNQSPENSDVGEFFVYFK